MPFLICFPFFVKATLRMSRVPCGYGFTSFPPVHFFHCPVVCPSVLVSVFGHSTVCVKYSERKVNLELLLLYHITK